MNDLQKKNEIQDFSSQYTEATIQFKENEIKVEAKKKLLKDIISIRNINFIHR